MKLQDVSTPSSRKPKAKKKDSDVVMSSVGPDQPAIQGCYWVLELSLSLSLSLSQVRSHIFIFSIHVSDLF